MNFSESNMQREMNINPIGKNGQRLRCFCCDSFRHMVRYCPHSQKMEREKSIEIAIIRNKDQSTESVIPTCEYTNLAILDGYCTSTVTGEKWLDCYIDSLPQTLRDTIVEETSDTMFRLGDGTIVTSLKKVTIPSEIGGYKCTIETDVVANEIPLILSRKSKNRAKIEIDSKNRTALIFGKEVQLQISPAYHLCVPIGQVIISLDEIKYASMSKSYKKICLDRLHKQFAHPSANKWK